MCMSQVRNTTASQVTLKLPDKFLDIPFTKTVLKSGDADFLDPNDFCNDVGHTSTSKTWLMLRTTKCNHFKLGSVDCSVRRQSVWENAAAYDLIVLPAPFLQRNDHAVTLPSTKAAIQTIKATWTSSRYATNFQKFDALLNQCGGNVRRVAMLPWLLGKYDAVIDAISACDRAQLQLDFYHLNESDFNAFYGIQT